MPKAATIRSKPMNVWLKLPHDVYIKLKIMGLLEAKGAISPVVERLVREAQDPREAAPCR